MKKSLADKATKRIQLRTTEAEKKKIEQAAMNSGFRNVSDYVRWCAIQKANATLPQNTTKLSPQDFEKVERHLKSGGKGSNTQKQGPSISS